MPGNYIFVVFSRPFFPLVSFRGIVNLVFVSVPKIRTFNIRRMPVGFTMLAIKRIPADHNTQIGPPSQTLLSICI